MANYKRIKVFISQPMSGLRDIEIDAVRQECLCRLYGGEFDRALRKIFETSDDCEFVFDVIPRFMPYFANEAPPKDRKTIRANRVYCLGNSIENMEQADLVVFDVDWYKAKGCRVEASICIEYGIPAVFMDTREDENSPGNQMWNRLFENHKDICGRYPWGKEKEESQE